MEKDETFAAGVAEVSVDPRERPDQGAQYLGRHRCRRRGAAEEPRGKTEGGIVWGVGHVLREKITTRWPRAGDKLPRHLVPRMSDIPNIEVKVLPTNNPPTGAGEDGVPLVGAPSATRLRR